MRRPQPSRFACPVHDFRRLPILHPADQVFEGQEREETEEEKQRGRRGLQSPVQAGQGGVWGCGTSTAKAVLKTEGEGMLN